MVPAPLAGFSALQRAEIAEIVVLPAVFAYFTCFSALQRAEIAEILRAYCRHVSARRFSALQRAEIAEIQRPRRLCGARTGVSVLFNEPKLLKSQSISKRWDGLRVSVLFNEPKLLKFRDVIRMMKFYARFQCSSTSRNC